MQIDVLALLLSIGCFPVLEMPLAPMTPPVSLFACPAQTDVSQLKLIPPGTRPPTPPSEPPIEERPT